MTRYSERTTKVLIGCPVYRESPYLLDKIAVLKAVQEEVKTVQVGVYMADNSDDNTFHKKLHKKGVSAGHVKPNGDMKGVLANCHEKVRKTAVNDNYDYLFHLEADVFPTDMKRAIFDLIWANVPVVGIPYNVGKGEERGNLCQVASHRGHGRYTVHDRPNFEMETGKGLQRVYNGGLGATMIHRKVFENIPFRWQESITGSKNDGKNLSPDSFFAYDLFKKGIPFYLHSDLSAIHYNMKPKGYRLMH